MIIFHPIYDIYPSFPLSLLVVTQIRGHNSRNFSPPPHYGSCHALFSREDFSSFFSLVDLRRTGLTHARRSQQLLLLILFYFCKQIQNLNTAGFELTDQQTLLR